MTNSSKDLEKNMKKYEYRPNICCNHILLIQNEVIDLNHLALQDAKTINWIIKTSTKDGILPNLAK